jgi:hypothetical protein
MKAVSTYTVEGFKSNKAATGRLAELLHDPVMEEALCIVQSKLNATLQPTMEAAALNGAFAAGAKSVIAALFNLAEENEETESPVTMMNHPMTERNAWINSLSPNR